MAVKFVVYQNLSADNQLMCQNNRTFRFGKLASRFRGGTMSVLE